MFLWMIFANEITPYFESGHSIETVYAVSLLWGVITPEMSEQERETAIREQFDDGLAEQLIKAAPKDLIHRVVFEWSKDSGPRAVAPGYFVHADDMNWDEGSLKAEIDSSDISNERLFWDDDELLGGEYEKPVYGIVLQGLCFDREALEMLQPNFSLPSVISGQGIPTPRVGRPRVWDWDAAILHLMSIAQTPDGLPSGAGAQAKIERLIADFFTAENGDSPAESQIRKHATKIMQGLKKPKRS